MIHYLVTSAHRYTIDWFRQDWAPELAGRIRVLPYEEAFDGRRFSPGTYIFSDLDRLSNSQTRAAIDLWRRLAELHPSMRLLNDPARVVGRYELLRMLHARGSNDFNVYRLRDVFASGSRSQPDALSGKPRVRARFPVYLRRASDHDGELSGLLHSWEEVREVGSDLIASPRFPLEDMIVVEFCDTADAQGTYRKYTSFVIGDAVVARAIMFSREWCVKMFDLSDPPYLEEFRTFVADNPYAAELRRIAGQAAIDYGRIDFAFRDERLQVWEINTNPAVAMPRSMFDPPGLETHWAACRNLAGVLAAVDDARPTDTAAAEASPPG